MAVPQLTEERRRELVKQAKHKGEEARVSVRNIRRKAMEELHRIRKDGEAGEDEVGARGKGPGQDHAPVRHPDRRAGQAQRRRAAGGLVAVQQPMSVADTDTGAGDPPTSPPAGLAATPKKRSRAGRNLPAAIAVGLGYRCAHHRDAGVRSARLGRPDRRRPSPSRPTRWCGGCARPDMSFRSIPLLVGGQATVWLTWPYHAGGALAGFGATAVVCMIWRLLSHSSQRAA